MFKKGEITLRCYTNRPDVFENFQIRQSAKVAPKWFKQVKPSYFDESIFGRVDSVKDCYGIKSMITSGVIIPLWTDLAFSVGMDGHGMNPADSLTVAEYHDDIARDSFLPKEEFAHSKIISPWVFECDSDIKWVWGSPLYHDGKITDHILLPAVMNFKDFHSTHVNVMHRKFDHNYVTYMHAGQPIVQLIPMTERRVKVECFLVGDEEFYQRSTSGYKKNRFTNSVGRYLSSKSKCPFHRGNA